MLSCSLKTAAPSSSSTTPVGAPRSREGIGQPGGYARVFYNNVIALRNRAADFAHLRALRRGAAYSPALTDFVIQTQQGRMFITGPQVIKQVTGEVVSAEELGGPQSQ